MSDQFNQHCIVELFGHQKIAGRVTEQTIAGQMFVRVDVPGVNGQEPFTKFFGGAAIYAMTPVSESACQIAASVLSPKHPITAWDLERLVLPARIAATTPDDTSDLAGYQVRMITQVTCYISGSGNTTWKAFDEDRYIVYLRQSHRDMLTEVGLWDQLNAMSIGDEWEAEIVIHTVNDGDFLKPVQIDPGGWVQPPTTSPRDLDRQEAIGWAEDLLDQPFVILDTETTGFEDDDEIVQVGVISSDGEVILDQLVKPTKKITNSDRHGITDAMVADAPEFGEVYEQVREALEGKTVVCWNLEYDERMLRQVCEQHSLTPISFEGHCAMKLFAQFYGEWNIKYANYRWKSLADALDHFDLDFAGREHNAVVDARATLAVIQKMAEAGIPF